MSAMLTLLFVCHESEDGSQFFAQAPTASDRLLLGRCSKGGKLLLPGEPVDAIILHQDHLQNGCSVLGDLKRAAPRTPVMLLRGRDQGDAIRPPGIVAVCSADLRDEKLVKSMWTFFRLILGKQAPKAGSRSQSGALLKECS